MSTPTGTLNLPHLRRASAVTDTDGAHMNTQAIEFMSKYGYPRPPTPVILAPEHVRTGAKAQEEKTELITAINLHDPIGIADGLGDLAYVSVITMNTYGVHSSLDHFTWDQPTPPKLTLDHGWDYCASPTQPLRELASSVNALAGIGKNPYAARWYGLRVLRSITGLAHAYGIPMREVFDEIHASNMTKTPVKPREFVKGDEYEQPVLGPIIGVES